MRNPRTNVAAVATPPDGKQPGPSPEPFGGSLWKPTVQRHLCANCPTLLCMREWRVALAIIIGKNQTAGRRNIMMSGKATKPSSKISTSWKLRYSKKDLLGNLEIENISGWNIPRCPQHYSWKTFLTCEVEGNVTKKLKGGKAINQPIRPLISRT